jgi:hypothetical protein
MRRLWIVATVLAIGLGSSSAALAAGKKKVQPKKGGKKPPASEPAPAEPAGATPDAGATEAPAEPAAAPAATPAPAPAAPAPARPAADSPAEAEAAAASDDGVDVDALRQNYEKIREKLFASRATSAAVGDALYSARLTIKLRYASGRFFGLKRVTIRLDGANVFDDAQGKIADDDAPRFESFVAPGKHVVTIRIEAVSKDDDRIMSTVEDSFTLDVPGDKQTTVAAKAEDGGDLGYAWKRSARGSYKLHLDVGVKAQDLPKESGRAAK